MLLFWLLGGAAALWAVAKIAAGNAVETVKGLGTGGGAGLGTGGSASGTQELSRDQKVALAKTMLMRWVYGEKDLADYNTLEVGAPGVNNYPGAASALTVILGANMKDGHAILTNGALNPTQILVPHKPGGELTYAVPSSGFAIFLRPLEGYGIFAEAGAKLDAYKPDPNAPSPKTDLPGEVSILMPKATPHLLSAANPVTTASGPAKMGSLDLTTGTPSDPDRANLQAQYLPDGDSVTNAYGTFYPLGDARNRYLAYLKGDRRPSLKTAMQSSAEYLFTEGYLQASRDLLSAVSTF